MLDELERLLCFAMAKRDLHGQLEVDLDSLEEAERTSTLLTTVSVLVNAAMKTDAFAIGEAASMLDLASKNATRNVEARKERSTSPVRSSDEAYLCILAHHGLADDVVARIQDLAESNPHFREVASIHDNEGRTIIAFWELDDALLFMRRCYEGIPGMYPGAVCLSFGKPDEG